MAAESDELRERLRSMSDELTAAQSQAAEAKQEAEQLTSALRRVIDLLPDDKKNEVIKFLVTKNGK